MSPKLNFTDIGDLQDYRYSVRTIKSIDSTTDTCVLNKLDDTTGTPPTPGDEERVAKIFYHCAPDSVLRGPSDAGYEKGYNAINGGAAGFVVGSGVVVLQKYDKTKTYVVAHTDGIRACNMYLLNADGSRLYSITFSSYLDGGVTKKSAVIKFLYDADPIKPTWVYCKLCPPYFYVIIISGEYPEYTYTVSVRLVEKPETEIARIVLPNHSGNIYPHPAGFIYEFTELETHLRYAKSTGYIEAPWNYEEGQGTPYVTSVTTYLTNYKVTRTEDSYGITAGGTVQVPTDLQVTYPYPSVGESGTVCMPTVQFILTGSKRFAVGVKGKYDIRPTQWEIYNGHDENGDGIRYDPPYIVYNWPSVSEENTQRWPVVYIYDITTMTRIPNESGVECEEIIPVGAENPDGVLREIEGPTTPQDIIWNVFGRDALEVMSYDPMTGTRLVNYTVGGSWWNTYAANYGRFMYNGEGIYISHLSGGKLDSLVMIKLSSTSTIQAERYPEGDIVKIAYDDGTTPDPLLEIPMYWIGKDYRR